MARGTEGTIQDGDTLVFFDFRADRMRQIVETFGIEPPFDTGTSAVVECVCVRVRSCVDQETALPPVCTLIAPGCR